jgi:hypothetical protein
MAIDIILAKLKEGPCKSSELARILVDMHNLTPEAARKRISRFGSPIARLPNIELSNNEKILYLESQQGSSDFKSSIKKILEDNNTAEGRVLRAIGLAGQTIPLAYLAKASGTVYRSIGKGKHSRLKNVLEHLSELELIESFQDGKYGQIIATPGWKAMSPSTRATIDLESIYLSMIQKWLIKLGFSSSDTMKVRQPNECCLHGVFEWDLMGPCYLNGLLFKKSKPKNNS